MGYIENIFKQMKEKNVDSDAQLASHNTSTRNLEVQMGQISQALNSRPKGALPSDTGHVMAVTTRSGRGGNAPTLSQRQLVDDEQVLKLLEQMHGYAKFIKDLVTKKRSINFETVKVTHQVSAIVHSMAPKLEDPGSFKIPCTIGSAEFAKTLCDLRASINLMPYSVFKTLGIGKPRPTSMRI
ncbi:uncharacterized protein [Nicotiana tomentosiformis]|uniref:uncharacterized protein n=1 Tax=Nicotiana tomentosiformis TaxID=4098 RepID=UPI00388CB23A